MSEIRIVLAYGEMRNDNWEGSRRTSQVLFLGLSGGYMGVLFFVKIYQGVHS